MSKIIKWEYLSFNRKLTNEDLDKIGNEGWELVTHTAVTTGESFGQYYIFKRRKES